MLQNWVRQRKTDAAIRRARVMLKEGIDTEEIIGYFKRNGFSQGMTSIALMAIDVGDSMHCKNLVVESSHWADFKDVNIALHQALEDYQGQEGLPKLGDDIVINIKDRDE